MTNIFEKKDIIVVKVRRFERLTADGCYLVEETLKKDDKYRKAIKIDESYIDIYTGDVIERADENNNVMEDEIRANTNYLSDILTSPEEKKIYITNEDVIAANNVYDYYMLTSRLKEEGKIVSFQQKRIF